MNVIFGDVYSITNINNGLVYVGSTSEGISRRFASHVSQAKLGYRTKLYNAMRQYKNIEENFAVNLLEHVEFPAPNDYSLLRKREAYYVNLFDSIKNGYNTKEVTIPLSTMEEDNLCYDFLNGEKNLNALSQKYSIDHHTVARILNERGLRQIGDINWKLKPIAIVDDDNRICYLFYSISDAMNWLLKNNYSKSFNSINLIKAADGETERAYGFKFRRVEFVNNIPYVIKNKRDDPQWKNNVVMGSHRFSINEEKQIVDFFLENNCNLEMKYMGEKFKCAPQTIVRILVKYGLYVKGNQLASRKQRNIAQCTPDGRLINIYDSVQSATNEIIQRDYESKGITLTNDQITNIRSKIKCSMAGIVNIVHGCVYREITSDFCIGKYNPCVTVLHPKDTDNFRIKNQCRDIIKENMDRNRIW